MKAVGWELKFFFDIINITLYFLSKFRFAGELLIQVE